MICVNQVLYGSIQVYLLPVIPTLSVIGIYGYFGSVSCYDTIRYEMLF